MRDDNPRAKRDRTTLLVALAASVVVGWVLAALVTDPVLRSDGLERVIRGMVSIKSIVLVGAAALAFRRLGRAITIRPTVGYIGAIAISGFAVGMLWTLSFLGLGTALLCVGVLVGLWGMTWDREIRRGLKLEAEPAGSAPDSAAAAPDSPAHGQPNAPSPQPPKAHRVDDENPVAAGVAHGVSPV